MTQKEMFIRDKYSQIKWDILCKLHPELRLHPSDPPFELHFSKKQQYLSCLISKNGCSSILSSILKYDFNEPVNNNDKIWNQKQLWQSHVSEHKILFQDESEIDWSKFAYYTKFVVLRNPFDRFISFINNTYKEKEYDYLFDKSLYPEQYVDSVLRFYPHMIKHLQRDRHYDKHAVPQRVYYEKYKAIFGDELKIVFIEDLPEYYERLTGHPLIKNNVTKQEEKICTKSSLTSSQKKLISKYLSKYEYTKDDEYTHYFQ